MAHGGVSRQFWATIRCGVYLGTPTGNAGLGDLRGKPEYSAISHSITSRSDRAVADLYWMLSDSHVPDAAPHEAAL